MKNFNNLFYGAIIVLIIEFNIWIRSGYKDSIRDWAKLNNCTIHNMEYMWFERGAFSVYNYFKYWCRRIQIICICLRLRRG